MATVTLWGLLGLLLLALQASSFQGKPSSIISTIWSGFWCNFRAIRVLILIQSVSFGSFYAFFLFSVFSLFLFTLLPFLSFFLLARSLACLLDGYLELASAAKGSEALLRFLFFRLLVLWLAGWLDGWSDG